MSDEYFPVSLDSRKSLKTIDGIAKQLIIKSASLTPNFSTQWVMEQLHISHRVVDELLWELKDEKLLEMLKQVGPLSYQYRITNAGIELARRLMDLCGYVGPVPVSMDDYVESVNRQTRLRQPATMENVRNATSHLTFSDEILEIATLAVASNRSLFIFGPSGNGKSSLGRALHHAVDLAIWIPYAIAIDNQIIRFYDPEYHHLVPELPDDSNHDPRWLKVRQPFVLSGGELTMDQLDLVYDRSVNYYEAPPHLKANCGTFFIDDLGRQRIEPFDLLNRWIVPLEQNIDFLSLVNGKKLEFPFQMMLIVATNLNSTDVSDPAFLRRMGYRIHLETPTEESFRDIFQKQAESFKLTITDNLIEHVIRRYHQEDRTWRASEPRDLLVRCQDAIAMLGEGGGVDERIFDLAWRGYFSNELF